MMLFKSLIKQQMKQKRLTYGDIGIKIGIPCSKVQDLIENMQNHPGVVTLEKIMTVLGLFTFDDEKVDKEIKKELKKFEKSKKDYIY